MPGVTWAKNLLLGKELTQKEMEDIPYPRLELHTHVMYKTIEVRPFALTEWALGGGGILYTLKNQCEIGYSVQKAVVENFWAHKRKKGCCRPTREKSRDRFKLFFLSFCAAPSRSDDVLLL